MNTLNRCRSCGEVIEQGIRFCDALCEHEYANWQFEEAVDLRPVGPPINGPSTIDKALAMLGHIADKVLPSKYERKVHKSDE